ncbi:MAG: hypothetical protein LBL37_03800, partial [Gracilibacteraceae bacterium]|nr:hypothetical protein [Gracilibacteraceae bacterium]
MAVTLLLSAFPAGLVASALQLGEDGSISGYPGPEQNADGLYDGREALTEGPGEASGEAPEEGPDGGLSVEPAEEPGIGAADLPPEDPDDGMIPDLPPLRGAPRAAPIEIDLSRTTAGGLGFTVSTGVSPGAGYGVPVTGDRALTFSGADASSNSYRIVQSYGPGTSIFHSIVISAGVDTTITLAGIDVKSGGPSPFALEQNAAVSLILENVQHGADVVINSLEHTYKDSGSVANNAALRVPVNASLTIRGSGRLEARGGYHGAGIGGGEGSADAGTITILSGTVEAWGTAASGIGGGYGGQSGDITIVDGDVTGHGGDYGAGIGGGRSEPGNGQNGSITIEGGSVRGYGGEYGAGIGGGFNRQGGTISISGGVVVARGGNPTGAGIGGSNSGSGGTISITGDADVTATGGANSSDYAAGIGGGSAGNAAVLTISPTAGVKAYSLGSAGASRPAIHASSVSGGGYFVNAYFDNNMAGFPNGGVTLEIYANGGTDVTDTLTLPVTYLSVTYRGFAYTTVSDRTQDDHILAYAVADGRGLGRVLRNDNSLPEIPSVNSTAPRQVKLGGGLAGTLTVSNESYTTAAFVNSGHDLQGANYVQGGFQYATSADMSGAEDVPWSDWNAGNITGNITGLAPGTDYYARSYLTTELTSGGVRTTTYSAVKTFKTLAAVEINLCIEYGNGYSGDGWTVSGTQSAQTLTFNSGAAGKAYRVIQVDAPTANASKFQNIAVSSGVSTTITLVGINVTCGKQRTPTFGLSGTASVSLILEGDNVLTQDNTVTVTGSTVCNNAALGVPRSGATLASIVISGSGSLTATGGYGSAGIGGGYYEKAGNITINGGRLEATGGIGGAGIGGGYNHGVSSAPGGTTVINGGELEAHGGGGSYAGAGIGGGGYFGNASGNVTINGGRVDAWGGVGSYYNGAGIGGGGRGGFETITITGGTVRAWGGGSSANDSDGGAGIGGDGASTNAGTSPGEIRINGTAYVEATGGTASSTKFSGAGIGDWGLIEIGGTAEVHAAAGAGTVRSGAAGIGGSDSSPSITPSIRIIDNARVTAAGGDGTGSGGAGIGGCGGVVSNGGSITIGGTATVRATGGRGTNYLTNDASHGTGIGPGGLGDDATHEIGVELGPNAVIEAYAYGSSYPAIKLATNQPNVIDNCFVNAYFKVNTEPSYTTSAGTKLDVYAGGGQAVTGTLNLPAGYRCFAYTTKSTETRNDRILAYHADGSPLGVVLRADGDDVNSPEIPSVELGATAVKLGGGVAGTLTVSGISDTAATFVNSEHDLRSTSYVQGGFLYSVNADMSGAVDVPWSGWSESNITADITGLTPGTDYYARSYLTTALTVGGVSTTTYSAVKTLKTMNVVEIDLSRTTEGGPGFTVSGGVSPGAGYGDTVAGNRTLTFSGADTSSNSYRIVQSYGPGTSIYRSIVVNANVSTTITIVGIDVKSGEVSVSPFALDSNATVSLILENALHDGDVVINRLEHSYTSSGTPIKNAALRVPTSASLTISGNGKLEARGGYRGAGIGGGYNEGGNAGTIVIKSGTVEAWGTFAAGIGGGYDGQSGDITIEGGDVTGHGGRYSAGIGGGWIVSGGANGSITITGGSVKAYGGDDGPGIGGGYNRSGGNITITGGVVVAEGGVHGAGIGSANTGDGGTIIIGGSARVTATGGGTHDYDGAPGIGGFGSYSTSLTISATATVRAYAYGYTGQAHPAIYAYSVGGDGYFVNAYFASDMAGFPDGGAMLDVYANGGTTRTDTLTLPALYRSFAYTTGSIQTQNDHILAYAADGRGLGQVLQYDNSEPEIPSVNKDNSVRRVKLGSAPGTPSVSNITQTGATFTSTGHNLLGGTFTRGGFQYSTRSDMSGAIDVPWGLGTLPATPIDVTRPEGTLEANTRYYLRTYLTTTVGSYYSGVLPFATLPEITRVSASPASDTTAFVSADFHVSGQNNAEITDVTVYWSTGTLDYSDLDAVTSDAALYNQTLDKDTGEFSNSGFTDYELTNPASAR